MWEGGGFVCGKEGERVHVWGGRVEGSCVGRRVRGFICGKEGERVHVWEGERFLYGRVRGFMCGRRVRGFICGGGRVLCGKEGERFLCGRLRG